MTFNLPDVQPSTPNLAQPISIDAPTGSQVSQPSLIQGIQLEQPDNSAETRNRSTIEGLLDLGASVLAPMVEKQKKEAFFQGVARAAKGTAVQEIVAEQPAWTRIFGLSASAQGAQQMTAINGITGISNSILEEMPELRKLSSDEFTKHVFSKLESSYTGDQGTDQLIQNKLVESLGALQTQHIKENAKYIQEHSKELYRDGMRQQAIGYETLVKRKAEDNTAVSDTDVDMWQSHLIGAVIPPAGMPKEMADAELKDYYQELLATGNLHTANLLESADAFSSLSGEDQLALVGQRTTAEKRLIEDVKVADLYPQLAGLNAEVSINGTNQKDLLVAMESINVKAARLYGFKEPVIGSAEKEAYLTKNYSTLVRKQTEAAEAARVAGDKEQLRQLKGIAFNNALVTGQGVNVIGGVGSNEEFFQYVSDKLLPQFGKNPIQVATQLANLHTSDHVNIVPLFRSMARRGLEGGFGDKVNPLLTQSVAFFSALTDPNVPYGDSAARTYFGEQGYVKLSKYMAVLKATGDANQANLAMNPPDAPAGTNKFERTAISNASEVIKGSDTPLADLHDSQREVLAAYLKPYQDRVQAGDPDPTKALLHKAMTKVEPLGKFFAFNPPTGVTSLKSALKLSSATLAGDVFTTALTQKFDKLGVTKNLPLTVRANIFNPDIYRELNVRIVRDNTELPRYSVNYIDPATGLEDYFTLTFDELKAIDQSKVQESAKVNDPSKQWKHTQPEAAGLLRLPF